MLKSKSLVLTFSITCLILAFIFFSVLYSYDPLRLFHLPWVYKNYLQSDMRKQAAGIINHWNFDSIILGTSMLECTSAQEASDVLDAEFINISLSGSYFYERSIVLNYVLQKKPIKKVIYSLDIEGLIYTGKSNGTFPIDSWDYLYDNNPFNDIQAYVNDKYIQCLFTLSDKTTCMGAIVDFDRPNTWHTLQDQAARFGGLDNWFKAKDNHQIKNAFSVISSTLKQIKQGKTVVNKNLASNIKNSKKYIDENILNYAKKYPETEFILVLPPYSRIKFAIDARYNQGLFQHYKASIRYLANRSSKYKNIYLFGWGNHAFVDNIANYKDLRHYEYKINSWMLGAIQRQEGLLTASNIDEYLLTLTKKSFKYKLLQLGQKIDNYLQ